MKSRTLTLEAAQRRRHTYLRRVAGYDADIALLTRMKALAEARIRELNAQISDLTTSAPPAAGAHS